jgi:phenylpropionate dioxygenase-like ring-hydroxylating dioxygenase large terminal subunit
MRPGLLDKKIELTRITFEEDRAVLESQQRNPQEFPGEPVVSIRSDSLSMAARRIWATLSAAEQGAMPSRAARVRTERTPHST